MNANPLSMIAAATLAIALIPGAAAFAEGQGTQDPKAEAQAFLASPTSLAQAISTAETASGGKVFSIEFQTGENGAPDLIMAGIIMADSTEKTVAINPADGKVLNMTVASIDPADGENGKGGDGGGDNGADGENANN